MAGVQAYYTAPCGSRGLCPAGLIMATTSLSILVGDKRDSWISDEDAWQRVSGRSLKTASRLEKLSTTAVEAINNRSFNEAKESPLFASGFSAKFDDLEETASLSEHADYLRSVAEAHPEYSVRVVNVSSNVDEAGGAATVYILMSVSGRPRSIRRQAMSVVRWIRQDNGVWLIASASIMRGMTASDVPGP
ncbi:hypothetical protein DOTSEDRAFT_82939 [Dothistroma septosporum NZE10]|uniref:SnoaL-like domain-containing protein n=1 Tax=Dothistroma septosporum (strain NZE10 / CBS 128990) TaxID=675120 RepID=N1PFJ0_DOTSN|nr:hypothetical protein DOTSEDRAFT_82939 [Dothistroma septosporum NZE10]